MRRRARRILFATVDSNWAGAQAQMLELAAGLDGEEFDPVVLTTGSGGLIERSRGARIRTHVFPYGFMRRRFPFLPYYTFGPAALRILLHTENIALVHTHCPNSAVPIMNAARGLKLPLVFHVHDLDQRWITPRTLRAQERPRSVVVAVSDAAARHVAERGVHLARLRRIYNGVHLVPLLPGARARARARLGIDEGEIAIALVGRLVRRKGAVDLTRALADPRLDGLRLRAFVIGGAEAAEPQFPRELEQLVAQLGVDRRVAVVGEQEGAAELHAGFDIAVVPARREAFGRAVVEAMHAGVPVVAYRDAALPELVREGEEGLLVDAGDVGALAEAIRVLAVDWRLRDRLGEAGRERARAFSHARFVEEVTTLYRTLLDPGIIRG